MYAVLHWWESVQRQNIFSGSEYTPWIMQILSAFLHVQNRMRNDVSVTRLQRWPQEPVRFQYTDISSQWLGCFDNRINLASRRGLLCWEKYFTEVIFPLVLHLSTKYQIEMENTSHEISCNFLSKAVETPGGVLKKNDFN